MVGVTGAATDAGPAAMLGGWATLPRPARIAFTLARLDDGVRPEMRQSLSRLSAREWGDVIQSATRHWILPLVAHRLAQLPSEALPREVGDRRAMALATTAARGRWRMYRELLQEVSGPWRARGVEPVLLKGAALCMGVYPEGTRLLQDLDLLVRPELLEAAASVLLAAGFRHHLFEGRSVSEQRRRSHGWVLVRDQGRGPPLIVDLHDRVVGPEADLELDPEALRSRGAKRMLGGLPVRTLSREDQFLHLAVQIATDLKLNPARWADLIALADPRVPYFGERIVRPQALTSRAAETGATAALDVALAWAKAGGGTGFDGSAHLPSAGDRSEGARRSLLDARMLHADFRRPATADAVLGSWMVRRPEGEAPHRRRFLGGWIATRRRRGAGRIPLHLWSLRTRVLMRFYEAVVRLRGIVPRDGALDRALGRVLWRRGHPQGH